MQEDPTTSIRVFTTLADTLFGVTFLALSPEHELLQRKELFADSALRAVDEMQKSSSLSNAIIDASDKTKQGLNLLKYCIPEQMLNT